MNRPIVFISYSHKDEVWKSRLVTHLKVLQTEGILDVWDDQRIEAGQDWQREIESAVNKASVAILLVSENFLTSRFILSEEVPRLLELQHGKGVRVFPVILKPCAWKHVRWLARMQVRPKDGTPIWGGSEYQEETNLVAIAEEIADIIKKLGHAPEPKTYVHLGPDKIFLSAGFPPTHANVYGRVRELALLDAAWESRQTSIVSLVAWAGVGKTALVKAWLNRMQIEQYRGARVVFGWSFYSQGAKEGTQSSADLFVSTALREFEDPNPNAGSPWDKGQRLAELCSSQRTLLILDGLEPLQYPAGRHGYEGRLKDPGLQSLLSGLARRNSGLCVITTRLPVDDLREFVGTSLMQIDLEDLANEAGVQLLESLGVKGPLSDLKQAVCDFGGHALALILLGGYLDVVFKGDVLKRDRIPRLIDERRQGGHARRVLESYTRWFEGKPELDILHIMGLFDRPVEAGALQALLAAPPIEGLTSQLAHLAEADQKYALASLKTARLLPPEDDDGSSTLDCHPLMREYFSERLQTAAVDAWRDAHSRLYEYYKAKVEEHPSTIEAMDSLYAAVTHGCQAERHQQALDEVYKPRIHRGSEAFSTRVLGAFSADLAALSGFFKEPWRKLVVGLNDDDQAEILSWAAYRLRSLGRFEEAIEVWEAGIGMWERLESWGFAARDSVNVSLAHLRRGELVQALACAERAVKQADRELERSTPKFGYDRSVHAAAQAAEVLHQMGRFQESEVKFLEAQERQRRWPEEPLVLYSYQGFQYRELLLDLKDYQKVIDQTLQMGELTARFQKKLGSALDQLQLGRARLIQAQLEGSEDLSEAGLHLESAVELLRQAGNRDELPRGLLARAGLYWLSDAFEPARRDLDEAISIAKSIGMVLYEADYHLECARLYVATGDEAKAETNLVNAKEIIARTGYHRRDREVAELEEVLSKDPS